MEKQNFDIWVEKCKVEFFRDDEKKCFANIQFHDEGIYSISTIYKMAECLRDHIHETEGEACNFKISFTDIDI